MFLTCSSCSSTKTQTRNSRARAALSFRSPANHAWSKPARLVPKRAQIELQPGAQNNPSLAAGTTKKIEPGQKHCQRQTCHTLLQRNYPGFVGTCQMGLMLEKDKAPDCKCVFICVCVD